MRWGELLVEFLQPIAAGVIIVLALLFIARLGMPERSGRISSR
jgi:hypothetical protein